MAADGSVIIDTRMDTTGVQNGVSAIKQSFNGLGSVVKKIGILIGGAFAIGKLTQFGKECTKLGSDLNEVQSVVNVVFPNMTEKVNEFSKKAKGEKLDKWEKKFYQENKNIIDIKTRLSDEEQAYKDKLNEMLNLK